MTDKTEEPTQVLLVRLLKTQSEIKHLTLQDDGTVSDNEWLRRLAGLRSELAAVYMVASHRHPHDSIEWHALREASLMHEAYAAANLAAADHNETTPKDGAA